MPSRNNTNHNKKSNGKNKNKNKKQSDNSATANIAEIAEAKNQSDEDYDEHFQSEHYLRLTKSKSNAKFANIDCLSPDDLIPLRQEAMRNPTNKQLKHNILDTLRKDKYRKWLIELKTGFNLLCYGVGSKKYILEDFGKVYCCPDPYGIVIRVNGFDETVHIKQILDALTNVMIDNDKKRKIKKNTVKGSPDIQQRARNIVDYLKENKNNLQYTYFYLIINNIDGNMLRKKSIQTALSILANCRYIHLVASIDHIHAMLLWDRNQLSMFHWVYHEITTYKHYFEEMEFTKAQGIKKAEKKSPNHGLEHIMESLTPNHREIIKLLAETQLEQDGMGLDVDDWYILCEDMCLVNNELKFTQYINEFIDHNVIIENSKRGNVVYTIPYDEEIIQKHLIDCEMDD